MNTLAAMHFAPVHAGGTGSNARSSQSRSTGASIGWMWGHAAVAFGLALCATFSKELGVTTFGLFACHEVVEALVHDASAVAAAPILVTAPQPLSEQFQAAWFENVTDPHRCDLSSAPN
jgi:hypothetical protein